MYMLERSTMTLPPLAAQAPTSQSLFVRFRHVGINVFIGVLYTFFAYSSFKQWFDTGNMGALLIAIQETIIISFVIFRRRSFEETKVFWEWLIAVGGTAAPLLLRPDGTIVVTESVGAGIQFVGMLVTLVALLSLSRSFGVVAANRGVRTGGLYRFVRHPLYGSYIIGYAGFLLGNPTVWNVLIVVLMLICQYLRTLAEERILLNDPAYQVYAANVRYRFIPLIF
jgi:protein-S-isoprenylcysteine O-methyltransferase Ste14